MANFFLTKFTGDGEEACVDGKSVVTSQVCSVDQLLTGRKPLSTELLCPKEVLRLFRGRGSR